MGQSGGWLQEAAGAKKLYNLFPEHLVQWDSSFFCIVARRKEECAELDVYIIYRQLSVYGGSEIVIDLFCAE